MLEVKLDTSEKTVCSCIVVPFAVGCTVTHHFTEVDTIAFSDFLGSSRLVRSTLMSLDYSNIASGGAIPQNQVVHFKFNVRDGLGGSQS